MASQAVFVGTSNVIPGTWPEKLSQKMGWTPRNYAVAGMGYTFTGGDSFKVQLQRAAADPAFRNDTVAFVFIADGANDARANSDVSLAAPDTIAYAVTTFPLARVIVLPALWTNSSVDLIPENRAHLMRVVNTLRTAAVTCGAEYIEGSWSWMLDEPNMVKPSEVHFNAAGYDRIVAWVQHYLRGSSTWNDIGWQDVTLAPQYSNPAVSTPKIRVMRTGNTITVNGEFSTPSGILDAYPAFTLPYGLRPARDVPAFFAHLGSVAPKHGIFVRGDHAVRPGAFIAFGGDSITYNALVNESFSAF